ncbi:MAG: hypothetical protein L3J72_04775 [Thermoplasmata archaeon]|nr:hypothetical protein [Thermoplasmata archaeon]
MGLTGSCGGEAEASRPIELAINGGGLATTLDFGGGDQRRLDELSALVTYSQQLGRVSLQLGAGAVLGGSLNGSAGYYRLNPGPQLAFSAGWTLLDGRGKHLYLAASLGAAFSTVTAQNETAPADQPRLSALDLRLSAVVGKQFFGFWLPYAGVSVFGGPVYFNPAEVGLVGTDVNHYRVSVGSSFELPAHLQLFAEAGFLGELSALLGLGYRY